MDNLQRQVQRCSGRMGEGIFSAIRGDLPLVNIGKLIAVDTSMIKTPPFHR